MVSLVYIIALIIVPPVLAASETDKPPARIANIYDGRDHQPTRSDVREREQAKGIAPNVKTRSQEDETLAQIYRQLIGKPFAVAAPAH
jgi:hypothetical protein